MNTSNLAPGTLIISLDLELYWGMRDVVSLDSYRQNLSGVRKAIAAMLQLFKEYEIHATWATVGFLYYPGFELLHQNLPEKLPQYRQVDLSPYQYISSSTIAPAPELHFCPEIIHAIAQHPGQEIATHTFSHYYCLEAGQTQAEFAADLQAAITVAQEAGIDTKSLVFPRNQYNQAYLQTIAECGIDCYRGNQPHPIHNEENGDGDRPRKRLLRLIDAYLNFTGHNTYSRSPLKSEYPVNIPASHFLRPYSPKLKYLDGLRLRRITKSLRHAANRGEIYHLWWHPHNFGMNLTENIRFLEQILQSYQKLKEQHKMQSLSMREVAELCWADNKQDSKQISELRSPK
ncbi:MAG: polysaccharide deacetylase family protein [Cyanobacteria bacterium J06623_7]